jgi:hypothetical protein
MGSSVSIGSSVSAGSIVASGGAPVGIVCPPDVHAARTIAPMIRRLSIVKIILVIFSSVVLINVFREIMEYLLNHPEVIISRPDFFRIR